MRCLIEKAEAMTKLNDLMAAHEKEVVAYVTKQLNNDHWRCNANDVGWLFEKPKFLKQFGRAARVYLRLLALTDHHHPFP
ncbi:hypothetical protein [Photobacterium kishitanii]|uniref:Uncharacterized protein n=1 Tax=Photobacterium kishitanii TaxID=318456 RepID=A0A2T3KLZ5_9GAMM|nr:hypothetical protein [Photobacterium kishitanii]PSV00703.1 hypothetical protein C9J27_06060 [Photobacterium kishitanii]